MFFKNTKDKIIELAKNAVLVAENQLGSGQGQEKKKLAIDYIMKNIQIPDLYKGVISMFLSGFIDDVVELAVLYMKSITDSKEI